MAGAVGPVVIALTPACVYCTVLREQSGVSMWSWPSCFVGNMKSCYQYLCEDSGEKSHSNKFHLTVNVCLMEAQIGTNGMALTGVNVFFSTAAALSGEFELFFLLIYFARRTLAGLLFSELLEKWTRCVMTLVPSTWQSGQSGITVHIQEPDADRE